MYWYWWTWLGAFVVPEGIAFARHRRGDTFSSFVWQACDVLPGQTIWQWSFAHLALACLMGWLFFHFTLGIWR